MKIYRVAAVIMSESFLEIQHSEYECTPSACSDYYEIGYQDKINSKRIFIVVQRQIMSVGSLGTTDLPYRYTWYVNEPDRDEAIRLCVKDIEKQAQENLDKANRLLEIINRQYFEK